MVEIEVSSSLGQSLFFLPLNRVLRGRLNLDAMKHTRDLADKFPHPIPGLVVGLDPETAKAWVRDPLYDAEHSAARAQLSSFSLGPAREEFAGVDVATWSYWLRNAVASGSARVVSGELPEVNGLARKSIFSQQKPEKDQQIDRLTGLVEKLTTAVADLLKLPESKRKALAETL
ncbi:MAG: hypothetical protein AB7U73_25725 [Pirellulales bacterium]